mmetsp:Transcript_66570/g.192210  ORF Transcript_66570/g.192210 Transcript_66570/m.192210 type:complete len:284 (-) Transcript_66570:2165-3016(-)
MGTPGLVRGVMAWCCCRPTCCTGMDIAGRIPGGITEGPAANTRGVAAPGATEGAPPARGESTTTPRDVAECAGEVTSASFSPSGGDGLPAEAAAGGASSAEIMRPRVAVKLGEPSHATTSLTPPSSRELMGDDRTGLPTPKSWPPPCSACAPLGDAAVSAWVSDAAMALALLPMLSRGVLKPELCLGWPFDCCGVILPLRPAANDDTEPANPGKKPEPCPGKLPAEHMADVSEPIPGVKQALPEGDGAPKPLRSAFRPCSAKPNSKPRAFASSNKVPPRRATT